MALTVTKVKKAQKQETVDVEAEVKLVTAMSDEDLADLYGDLHKQVEELKKHPAFTKFEAAEKELKARIQDGMESEDTGELSGNRWVLDIGACSKNARTLKKGAIKKIQSFLDLESFLTIAKVNIGDCEKYLTPVQCEQVIESDTGYSEKRNIKVKPLA